MSFIITKSEFKTDHFNGKDFSLNPLDTTTHILGSVMNKVKATFEIDVYWETISTVSLEFEVLQFGGNTIIKRNYGSFLDDEFCLGDIVCLESDLIPTSSQPHTITSITDLEIVINGATLVPDGIYTDSPFLKIIGISDLDGLVYKFGLVENGSPANYTWIDGKEQAYQSGGLLGGGSIQMNKVGSICSWQTGSAEVEFLGNVTPKGNIKRFRVCHEFIITPYFENGQKTNLQNNIPPTIFNGTNSLNYVFSAEFRNTLTNPNCKKEVTQITPLGNVKWFNQPLNGVDEYSVLNASYQGASGCVEVGVLTNVCITVNSQSGLFAAGQKVGFYFSALPDATAYSCTTTDFYENWCYDCFIGDIGTTTNLTGDPIKSVTINLLSPNTIEICADILVNKGFTSQDCYVIGVDVSDQSNTGNKTMLIGDVKNFYRDLCVPGLLDFKEVKFYDHVTNLLSPNHTTDYKGHIEDGILFCNSFCLNVKDGAFLKKLDIKLVAYNPTTGNSFEIERYPLDLSSQVLVPIAGNITQQITLNTTQGFNLSSGSQYNVKTINTSLTLVNGVINYDVCVGIKFCWQDIKPLSGVDPVFYDPTKPFNGFNTNVSNYNGVNGYFLRMAICADVSDGNIDTPYIHYSPNLDICNYNSESDWTYLIQTFDESGFNTQCNILQGEDTTIRINANTTGTAPDLADLYGIIRLEPKNTLSKNIIEENSTARNNLLNLFKSDPVISKPGSNSYLIETTLNGNRISKGSDYKVSFKIGCPGADVECIPPVITMSKAGISENIIEFSYSVTEPLPLVISVENSLNQTVYKIIANLGDNLLTGSYVNEFPFLDTWFNLQPHLTSNTSLVGQNGNITINLASLIGTNSLFDNTSIRVTINVFNDCGESSASEIGTIN